MNFYREDPALADLFGLYLPDAERRHVEPWLDRLGGLVGDRLDDLAFEADRNPPQLRVRDRQGRDSQSIEKHPAYREMERIAFGEFEMAAMSHRPALGWNRSIHPVGKYAFQYLFAQSEFGLLCPLSMTDALTRTLIRFGDAALIDRYLPSLAAQDGDALVQGAMFMTEQEAGSDVGGTATIARPDGEAWRLYGDKWFCSNPDAGLALVLARPEGAKEGTRGLGLFLMPRMLPDGTTNSYRILRLKDKLGTRSMASGEIVLEGARAWLVGELERGFVQMAEMINQSRLSNGVRAAGMMRRAMHEALAVARGREAFGERLIDLPLMRRQLLKIALPAEQALSICLNTAVALKAADDGDPLGIGLRRILTPLVKFRACRDARKVTGDAMEVRGGCGYVEEWIEARLVRDSHLGSIWEGTSNIVALDVLRAIRRENAASPLVDSLQERLESAVGIPAAFRSRLSDLLIKAVAMANSAAHGGRESEHLARQAASGLYNSASAVMLAWEGAALGARGGDARRLIWARLVADHRLSERDPLAPQAAAFEGELDCLLRPARVTMAQASKLVTL